jgi:hypothetical protein
MTRATTSATTGVDVTTPTSPQDPMTIRRMIPTRTLPRPRHVFLIVAMIALAGSAAATPTREPPAAPPAAGRTDASDPIADLDDSQDASSRDEAAASSPPLRTLITSTLERTTVKLLAITPAGVTVAPANVPDEVALDAAMPLIPRVEVVALFEETTTVYVGGGHSRSRAKSAETTPLWVRLVDGQRFRGAVPRSASPADADPPTEEPLDGGPADAEPSSKPRSPHSVPASDPDRFVFMTENFGLISVPLEDISSITPVPDAAPARGETDSILPGPVDRGMTHDRVVLVNGDAIDGFVESIASVVTITPASASPDGGAPRQPIVVPVERCRSIRLLNPPRSPAGSMLWLSDGVVVAAADVAMKPGQRLHVRRAASEGEPAAASVTLDPATLQGLVFNAGSVVALASLPIASYQPDVSRRWSRQPVTSADGIADSAASPPADPVPLDLHDVRLPGPMSVLLSIPAGTRQISGRVSLPPESILWADCSIAIEIVEGDRAVKVFGASLNGASPSADLSVRLPRTVGAADAMLRITLDPGDDGSILDRVVFERCFIVKSPAEQ